MPIIGALGHLNVFFFPIFPASFDFRPFRQELEVCYLGRDIGSEKVAWLPPEDPRSQVRPGAPEDPSGIRHEMGTYQWPFQEPKLEVPTIYKAYIRPM